MTLTQAQIKEMKWAFKSSLDQIIAGGDGDPQDLPELITLCNMALNSIPKAFDQKNPPEPGEYWVIAYDAPYKARWGGEAWLVWDGAIWMEGGTFPIAHYMPIPEVGESK